MQPTTNGIVTLTTDFGVQDLFVGVVKGVILGINRVATLVDITHGIPPQDIPTAALVVDAASRCFPPGTVHVVVVDPGDGERTMYPDRAAAAELAPIEHEWLTGTTVLHVPAYGFATDPAAGSILGAIEYVRRRGARLSIDVSAVTLIEEFGRDGFSELLDRLAPEVVVKDGPRPAVVMLDDGSRHEVAAVAVTEVRDTTGAGDAFAAGFLATWIRDADPITACAAGHLVAATVLTSVGSG